MSVDEPALEPGTVAVAEPTAPRSRNASAKALLTNALSGYATLILGALIGFVCTPLLLHRLGTTRFGTYSELLALAAYLSLLELGLGTATTTRIAASEHSGPEAVALVARTAILLFTIVGLAAAVVSIGLTFVMPHLFRIPQALHNDAQLAFVAIGFAQAVGSSKAAWTAVFLGTGRMYLVNFAGGAISMAASIATVVAAELGGSLAVLGAVQLVGATVTLALFRTVARRALPESDLTFRGASRDVAKRLLSLGWRNAIGSVMGTLAFGSDVVLIGLLLTPRAAAAYAIALRGYSFLQTFVTTALGAFGPAHAHRAAVDDTERAFDMLAASLLMTLALALLCAVPVACFAPVLLHLWLGPLPHSTSVIVRVFCAVLVVQSAGQASAVLLINFERAGAVMMMTTLSACVNVAASVALTATVGVTGPAWGSLIAVTLIDLTVFPYRTCRVLDRSVWELLARCARPLVIPTVIFAAMLWLARALGVGGLLVLPVCGIAAGADLAMVWFTPAVRTIRSQFTS